MMRRGMSVWGFFTRACGGLGAFLAAQVFAAPLSAKVADSWWTLPSLPVARQEVGVAALEGKVYVIGGILSNRAATGIVSAYDVKKKTWESLPPLPDDTRLHHIGVAGLEGKVYAVGGLNSSFRGVTSVFAFDPAGGTWGRVADLPWPRGSMGVASVGGRIHAVGGQNGSTSYRDFASYSPDEDAWEVLPPMRTARNHLAAVGFEGRFYAVGGRSRRLFGELEMYDPATGEWQSLPPMPTPRAGIAAAMVEDEIFVFGGEGNAQNPTGIFPQTESYDISRGRWFTRQEMKNPRHGIGAATVDHRIFIPGGSPAQGFGVTDVHDAFVPGTPPDLITAPFRRGDANIDLQSDLSDAVTILFHLFLTGEDLPCRDAADADDTGTIELTDAIFLLQYLFLGGLPPPPPGPVDIGHDPTEDDLRCAEYPL